MLTNKSIFARPNGEYMASAISLECMKVSLQQECQINQVKKALTSMLCFKTNFSRLGFVAYSVYLNNTLSFGDRSGFTELTMPYLAKGYQYYLHCQDLCVALAGHDPVTGHSSIVMLFHALTDNCWV